MFQILPLRADLNPKRRLKPNGPQTLSSNPSYTKPHKSFATSSHNVPLREKGTAEARAPGEGRVNLRQEALNKAVELPEYHTQLLELWPLPER